MSNVIRTIGKVSVNEEFEFVTESKLSGGEITLKPTPASEPSYGKAVITRVVGPTVGIDEQGRKVSAFRYVAVRTQ